METKIIEENSEVYFKDLMLGNGRFILPVKHICKDGSIVEEITINEMTGEEEEIMMKKDNIINPGLVVTSVVSGVVKELTRSEVQRMITGNRDFCFIASCFLSFANENSEISITSSCPVCRGKLKNFVIVPKMRIIRTGIVNDQEIQGEFKKLRKKYTSILTTGEIQERMGRSDNRDNLGAMITLAMENCIKTIEGEKHLDKRVFKKLASKDRMDYMKFIGSKMSGIDTDFVWRCKNCNEVEIKLDPMDFFTAD